MKYMELRARHQDETTAFPIGAAFSEKRFDEMMSKWGLKPEDTKEIASLGCGCFIRKKDIAAFNEMSDRHKKEMRNFLASDDGLKLRALGLPKEDRLDERTARVFREAWKEFWNLCCKNDWF